MHVDNVHKDADFKSVPSKILDEKSMIIEKLKTARKEKENTHFIMCDSMDRYEEAR
jgi:transcription initiation factor IIE alpha subunit